MPVDYNTALGKVRLLIADLSEPYLLADTELSGYLTLNSDNPYRAAADALDAMATSEVLLSKKIRTQDLNTDGPAVAAELRKQAIALRARADEADALVDVGMFEIIAMNDEYAEAAERYL